MQPHILSAKKSVEKYELRIPGTSDYWADIIIESHGQAGRIWIVSDYCTKGWTYFWGSCGCPFKEFLQKLTPDMDYAAKKFQIEEDFDQKKTISDMESMADEAYMRDAISYNDHIQCLLDIGKLKDYIHQDEFIQALPACSYIKIMGDYPTIHTKVNYMFQRFWREVWPSFVEILKAESDNRKGAPVCSPHSSPNNQ